MKQKVWLSLVALAVVMGALLFIPAGTVRYWRGWVYLAMFFGVSVFQTVYLIKHDPALLARRLRGGPTAEKSMVQRIIMTFTSLGFIGLLVIPSLDFRFGWSHVPVCLSLAGDFLVLLGFAIISRVYRENSFTSATIEISEGQRVISTGPYALVRHPMYAGALLYLLGTPLALGSFWGLAVFSAIVPFLIWRLLDEEQFLAKNLTGYAEYQAKVRWRLIPGVY